MTSQVFKQVEQVLKLRSSRLSSKVAKGHKLILNWTKDFFEKLPNLLSFELFFAKLNFSQNLKQFISLDSHNMYHSGEFLCINFFLSLLTKNILSLQ